MFPAKLGNFYCKPMDAPRQTTDPVSPNPNVFENFITAENTKHKNKNDGIKHVDLFKIIIAILCYYITVLVCSIFNCLKFFFQLCSKNKCFELYLYRVHAQYK